MAEQCSFAEVLQFSEVNNPRKFTSEELTKIINTKEIDLGSATTAAKNLYLDINVDIGQYHCQEIIDLLEKTNSELLFTGDTAQQNIQKIEEVRDKLSDLLDEVIALNDNEYGIAYLVNLYNNSLKTVKNGAKIQLLRQIADQINEAAEAKSTKYLYFQEEKEADKTTKDAYYSDLYIEESELRATWYDVKEIGDDKYKVTKNVVAYCNYWDAIDWGKHNKAWYNPFTWGDDNLEKLQSKIQTIASNIPDKVQIPYDM